MGNLEEMDTDKKEKRALPKNQNPTNSTLFINKKKTGRVHVVHDIMSLCVKG